MSKSKSEEVIAILYLIAALQAFGLELTVLAIAATTMSVFSMFCSLRSA